MYNSIVAAGIHKAKSIKVAEASKVIENAQRDINIAFVNELAVIFDKMNIETSDVLEAASTKWNFMKFKPGLVGGHCIGVDPYYFIYKAKQLGYNSKVINAGRKINDELPTFIANKILELMIENELKIKGNTISVFGLTFKENTPDTRNAKILDVMKELSRFKINFKAFDPYVEQEDMKRYKFIRISILILIYITLIIIYKNQISPFFGYRGYGSDYFSIDKLIIISILMLIFILLQLFIKSSFYNLIYDIFLIMFVFGQAIFDIFNDSTYLVIYLTIPLILILFLDRIDNYESLKSSVIRLDNKYVQMLVLIATLLLIFPYLQNIGNINLQNLLLIDIYDTRRNESSEQGIILNYLFAH